MDTTDEVEIPVWYGGVEKWITGIHRRTTCEDVVRALISSHHSGGDNNNNRKNSENHRDFKDYVIVEKWRKIERVLDAKSKILKLWSKWGEEQSNVKLCLKKIQQPQLKNVNKRHKTSKSSSHPKKVPLDGTADMTQTVDKLMKLIMSQTETISYQLATLLDKDKKIEEYETQIHKLRMTQIGTNYVQDAYLPEPSTTFQNLPESNEKCEEEKTPKKLEQEETEEAVQIYQKILDLCLKLEKEENNAITLQAKLKEETEADKANDVKVLTDVALTNAEIERLTAVFNTRENVLRQNDKIISESDRTLSEKRQIISQLEMDLEKADRETECLQREYQQLLESSQHHDVVHRKSDYCVTNANLVIPSSIDNFPLSCRGETESLDSDTGLSSLHSSENSEEGGYVLDTLV